MSLKLFWCECLWALWSTHVPRNSANSQCCMFPE